MKKKTNYKKGSVMLLTVIFFLIAGVTLSLSASAPLAQDIKTASTLSQSTISLSIAESAVEDAIGRFKKGRPLPSSYELALGGSRASVLVASVGGIDKEVSVTGSTANVLRKIKARFIASQSGLFKFGIQVGSQGLTLDSNSTISGNIYSNGNISGNSNTTITGDASAVGNISSPLPAVSGVKTPGAPVAPMPYVDVEYWKAQANINNDPIQGDYEIDSGITYLGPKRINGNFRMRSNSKLIITGPIYVTGTAEFASNENVSLDESFGSRGTVFMVDGAISINSNNEILGTNATPKGYLLIMSNDSSSNAIDLNSNATINAVVFAPNGSIDINSNAHVTAAAAERINLDSNASVVYDTGLLSEQFTSGPSGGFDIKSWTETE